MRRHFLIFGITFLMGLWVVLVGLDAFFPPNLQRFHEVSKELRTNSHHLVHVFQTKDDKWRLQAHMNEIDPTYIDMLVHREDRYFWNHWGVNPFSLLRAAYQWFSHGKVISGGSTLTMQVARLLEPQPRTLKAKFIEGLRALQLEHRFSKKEILEIYLTLAPYGSNIEGIRAASLSYFGKPASEFIPSESALLIALPQNPRLWTPKGFLPQTQTIRNRILTQSYKKGFIDEATYQIALKDPLPRTRFSLPRGMPHLARRLCFAPQASTVSLCLIRPDLQKRMESLTYEISQSLPKGVNLALLIVHHPSREVVAYVGSGDFLNTERQGQVDFIQAYRSPGSTLKPFIYGLGFDQGLIQPSTYILDDRQRFGSYRPHNFDKTFHGMVTIREALALSLNIPVIQLLSDIGPQRFVGILEEAGTPPKFPDLHSPPGLSLALGGVGMSLEQLVTLYASLPEQGQVLPLKFMSNQDSSSPYQFLSARSAGQLTDILSQTLINEMGQPIRNLAVKTGTSYGHRDAWALGYNAEYTVGVWVGRPDGAPLGLGTGRTLAVPVLQQAFLSLPASRKLAAGNSEDIKLKENPEIPTVRNQKLHKHIPQMLFPIDGSVIESFSEKGAKPIMLTALGGKRPYTWFVDGKPLVTQLWNPRTSWKPEKPGFYQICLLDAQGLSQSVNIEVQ